MKVDDFLNKILVDADACPVKQIIEEIAKQYGIEVIMFIDTSHELSSDYSKIITVCQGKDAADFAIVNMVKPNDIVVTQDYGVATMSLAKHALVLNQNGLIYTDQNIDKLLFERHIAQKIRRSGGKTSNAKKRSKENDIKFRNSFIKLCEAILVT